MRYPTSSPPPKDQPSADWREKVRLVAVSRGLQVIKPVGEWGWVVKEGFQEYAFQPLTNAGQCHELIVHYGLCVYCQQRSRRIGNTGKSVKYLLWWVRRHAGLHPSARHDDLNQSVVDYIADKAGTMQQPAGVRRVRWSSW